MGRWVKVTDQVSTELHGLRVGKVLMRVVAHCSPLNRDRTDVVLERSSARVERLPEGSSRRIWGDVSQRKYTIGEPKDEVRFHRAALKFYRSRGNRGH